MFCITCLFVFNSRNGDGQNGTIESCIVCALKMALLKNNWRYNQFAPTQFAVHSFLLLSRVKKPKHPHSSPLTSLCSRRFEPWAVSAGVSSLVTPLLEF